MRRHVPVGRAGTVEEVAVFVASLFAEDVPYLTGQTICMDGGQSIAP